MMPTLRILRLLAAATLLALAATSTAVMLSSGYDDEKSLNPDFEIALSAVARKDWEAAIEALKRVVRQRGWDDDAHVLLGFAYRKRGDYRESLRSYQRALTLNPHHRGALAYLGEAYIELGDRRRALSTLERLGVVCRQQFSTASASSWRADCPEWVELEQGIRDAR